MEKTEIIILGTIHSFHQSNTNFSYDDVFQWIDFFKPNILGLEIREEDFYESKEYLKKYYPYEMIEAKFLFENHTYVCGFDYYDQDVQGRLIPNGYFENSNRKKLEKLFQEDPSFLKTRELLEIIDQSRLSLITSKTAIEINQGTYDELSKIYYKQLECMLRDSPYQDLSAYYSNRDHHICQNILNIIQEHQGKRIMFIMGVDHRVFAIEAINQRFKKHVVYLPIQK